MITVDSDCDLPDREAFVGGARALQPARMQRVNPLPLFVSVDGNAEKPVPPPIPRGTPVGNRFAPVRTDALLATIPILGIVEPARRSTK